MGEPLADKIIHKIESASSLSNKLILIVGPTGTGKTKALQDVQVRTGTSLLNVSLELSRRMLELTRRQRTLRLLRLLRDVVNEGENDLILLDNTEILFDVELQLDPLRLLQNFSRNNTVVSAWNGTIVDDHLIYATPGHPDYRRIALGDFLVLSLEATT